MENSLNVFTLNDVLRKVSNAKTGLSITSYLNFTHNINDYNVSRNYSAKLLKDGYVTIEDLTNREDKALPTKKGIDFIRKGCYRINALDLIKKTNKEARILTQMGIINNKNMINHALEELYTFEDKIEAINTPFTQDLSRFHNNIKVVLKKVFEEGHEIFQKGSLGVITKTDLLELCTNAINYLEFELLGSHADFSTLHPLIIKVSHKQFLNQQYRDAVANAFTAVVEFLKEKHKAESKGKLIDGKPLMEHLFNSNSAVVRFSDDVDKQDGLKMVFTGAISAFRNKHVHNLKEIENENYAFDLLHYASLLIRLAENPKIY